MYGSPTQSAEMQSERIKHTRLACAARSSSSKVLNQVLQTPQLQLNSNLCGKPPQSRKQHQVTHDQAGEAVSKVRPLSHEMPPRQGIYCLECFPMHNTMCLSILRATFHTSNPAVIPNHARPRRTHISAKAETAPAGSKHRTDLPKRGGSR
jgi:hypothetical protein